MLPTDVLLLRSAIVVLEDAEYLVGRRIVRASVLIHHFLCLREHDTAQRSIFKEL
jgi:hypothetical protein